MANRIGTFTKTDNGFTGTIHTAANTIANVSIVPLPPSPNPKAPGFRVRVGAAEVGAGWATKSKKGTDYLQLLIDDPTWPAAIRAQLFAGRDGGFDLTWSR